MVPVRLVSTQIRFLDGRRNPVDLVNASPHHRNETLTGIADPMLLGAATHAWGRLRVTGRAGLSIPLGRTEENPFLMPEVSHQHVQMGTGTVNPIVAGEVAYGWDKWRVAAFVFTQQTVYENSKGYKAGDRYAAGAALRRALGAWGVRGGLEMQAESYESWSGMRYLDEGNQGRVDAMFAAGASWAATAKLSVDLTLKIPFINHVVGGQLNMPALLEVGASWSFGASAKPAAAADEHAHGDEHDHDEHGHDEHGHDDKGHDDKGHDDKGHDDKGHDDKGHVLDTSGADVADLGKDGAAVDLVPVAGKVTIFDFWAPWCEPCKTLEPVLVELARKYPDRVALRRIDVVDWDSPVVAQHLTPRAFDLPHVKVTDAAGKIVLEESSGPGKLAKMIEMIRSTVEAAAGGKAAPAAPVKAAPAQPVTPAPAQPVTPAPAQPVTPAPAQPVTPAPAQPVKPAAPPPATKRVEVVVTERGFEPGNVIVPRGVPVTLRFHRKIERTCATEVVLQHAGQRVEKKLPLDQPVELTLTFATAGTVTYACAMDMIRGTITVR